MPFQLHFSDDRLRDWLSTSPSEDELREAYLLLEAKRADLWTPGHIDSFRRDRYDRDARFVRQLVQVKAALARQWVVTGQLAELELPQHTAA